MTAIFNRKTGRYECYDSQVGDVVVIPEREHLSLEEEREMLAQSGEWCGCCKASNCKHLLGADGIDYQAGSDLPSWPDVELPEDDDEEEEDPFAGFQYEGSRHQRIRREPVHRSERPQRPPR